MHPAVKEFFKKNARKGGKARAAKLTSEERADIAKRAARARWGKKKEGARREKTSTTSAGAD